MAGPAGPAQTRSDVRSRPRPDTSDFDLEAYLARIGVPRTSSLAEIHRAHLRAIPFENLDPHGGVAVSLDLAALQDKLVTRRRGGYCFEQNLLLSAALRALGCTVEMCLARSRWNPPLTPMPRTHLVLRVDDGNGRWLCDVGFGPGSLLEPVPFAPGGPHEQSGWRLRIVEELDQLILQTRLHDVWRDVCAIDPTPVTLIDVEVSNWYVCTHPDSWFVTGLTVGIVAPDGSHLTLRGGDGLELVSRTPISSQRRGVARGEVPALLETHFGLPGFRIGQDGRIRPSA